MTDTHEFILDAAMKRVGDLNVCGFELSEGEPCLRLASDEIHNTLERNKATLLYGTLSELPCDVYAIPDKNTHILVAECNSSETATLVASALNAYTANRDTAEAGLSLLRQLVGGSENSLRHLDVFQCNEAEHSGRCECFWEQCEAWAKADTLALAAKGDTK